MEFLRYIWNFERTETPEIEEELRKHGHDVPVFVLRRPSEVRRMLARVENAV